MFILFALSLVNACILRPTIDLVYYIPDEAIATVYKENQTFYVNLCGVLPYQCKDSYEVDPITPPDVPIEPTNNTNTTDVPVVDPVVEPVNNTNPMLLNSDALDLKGSHSSSHSSHSSSHSSSSKTSSTKSSSTKSSASNTQSKSGTKSSPQNQDTKSTSTKDASTTTTHSNADTDPNKKNSNNQGATHNDKTSPTNKNNSSASSSADKQGSQHQDTKTNTGTTHSTYYYREPYARGSSNDNQTNSTNSTNGTNPQASNQKNGSKKSSKPRLESIPGAINANDAGISTTTVDSNQTNDSNTTTDTNVTATNTTTDQNQTNNTPIDQNQTITPPSDQNQTNSTDNVNTTDKLILENSVYLENVTSGDTYSMILINDAKECFHLSEQDDIDQDDFQLEVYNRPLEGITIMKKDNAKSNNPISIQLICDDNVVLEDANLNNTNSYSFYSKFGCPTLLQNPLFELYTSIYILFAIVLLGIGLFLATVGFVQVRLSGAILSFLNGIVWMTVLVSESSLDYDSNVLAKFVVFFAAFTFAILLAQQSLNREVYGHFNLGFAMGTVISLLLNSTYLYHFSYMTLFITAASLSIILGLIGCCYFNQVGIASTSLVGAFLIVRPLSWFTAGYPNDLLLNKLYKYGYMTRIHNPYWFYLAFILIFAAISAYVQNQQFKSRISLDGLFDSNYYYEMGKVEQAPKVQGFDNPIQQTLKRLSEISNGDNGKMSVLSFNSGEKQ